MFDKILSLRNKGYVPDIIFDIGAHHGNWTKSCLQIYPRRNYLLFEAIDYQELKLFQAPNISVFNEVLNDKIEEVEWFEMQNTGDSMFKEKSIHFKDCVPLKKITNTLDNIIENNKNIIDIDNIKNVFIKIDCQGAEIPILKGASNILKKTDFIILEIPLFGQYNENVPSFIEHINFMNEIGFITYDIVDNHYINGFNMQVDVLFINKNHSFNTIVNELLLK